MEELNEKITEVKPLPANGRNEEKKENKVMPVIALRGKALFPNTFLNFDAGRPISLAAVEAAPAYGNLLFIAAQKNAVIDAPVKSDILEIGAIARIKQVARINGGVMKVGVEAIARARIVKFVPAEGYFAAEVEEAPYIDSGDEILTEAYFRVARDAFLEYALFDNRIRKDAVATITAIDEPNRFIDGAMSVATLKDADVQGILLEDNTVERLKAFDNLFRRETEIAKIETSRSSSVQWEPTIMPS